MLSMKNEGRLEKLAKLLETNADNSTGLCFNMHTWGASSVWLEKIQNGEPKKADLKTSEIQAWKPELSCGTTACAWGLAAVSGIFYEEGVFCRVSGACMEIQWGSFQDFKAAQEFFGLELEEAAYLFLPSSYLTHHQKGAEAEKYVAVRIREVIEHKKAHHNLTKDHKWV